MTHPLTRAATGVYRTAEANLPSDRHRFVVVGPITTSSGRADDGGRRGTDRQKANLVMVQSTGASVSDSVSCMEVNAILVSCEACICRWPIQRQNNPIVFYRF